MSRKPGAIHRELSSTCIKKGFAVFPLLGFSAESLQRLRNEKGFRTDIDAAKRAYEFSQGRIGLINGWLNSVEDNSIERQSEADMLAAHYSIEYDRLTQSQQILVKTLASVYPRGLPLGAVATLMETTVSAVDSALLSLSPFIQYGVGAVSLKSDHVLLVTI